MSVHRRTEWLCTRKKWAVVKYMCVSLDCNFTNIIYAIQCKTCKQNGNDNCQYIRQTGRRLQDRLKEHHREILTERLTNLGLRNTSVNLDTLLVTNRCSLCYKYTTNERALGKPKDNISLAWLIPSHQTVWTGPMTANIILLSRNSLIITKNHVYPLLILLFYLLSSPLLYL